MINLIDRKPSGTSAIAAYLLCSTIAASANPVSVDPLGSIQSYVFYLIAAGTITIETALLCLFTRIFHQQECGAGTKVSFVLLNILTLFVVLMPLMSFTGSVIIAELGVVVAEGLAILFIIRQLGIKLSLGLALLYSLVVNLISYGIGALLQ